MRRADPALASQSHCTYAEADHAYVTFMYHAGQKLLLQLTHTMHAHRQLDAALSLILSHSNEHAAASSPLLSNHQFQATLERCVARAPAGQAPSLLSAVAAAMERVSEVEAEHAANAVATGTLADLCALALRSVRVEMGHAKAVSAALLRLLHPLTKLLHHINSQPPQAPAAASQSIDRERPKVLKRPQRACAESGIHLCWLTVTAAAREVHRKCAAAHPMLGRPFHDVFKPRLNLGDAPNLRLPMAEGKDMKAEPDASKPTGLSGGTPQPPSIAVQHACAQLRDLWYCAKGRGCDDGNTDLELLAAAGVLRAVAGDVAASETSRGVKDLASACAYVVLAFEELHEELQHTRHACAGVLQQADTSANDGKQLQQACNVKDQELAAVLVDDRAMLTDSVVGMNRNVHASAPLQQSPCVDSSVNVEEALLQRAGSLAATLAVAASQCLSPPLYGHILQPSVLGSVLSSIRLWLPMVHPEARDSVLASLLRARIHSSTLSPDLQPSAALVRRAWDAQTCLPCTLDTKARLLGTSVASIVLRMSDELSPHGQKLPQPCRALLQAASSGAYVSLRQKELKCFAHMLQASCGELQVAMATAPPSSEGHLGLLHTFKELRAALSVALEMPPLATPQASDGYISMVAILLATSAALGDMMGTLLCVAGLGVAGDAAAASVLTILSSLTVLCPSAVAELASSRAGVTLLCHMHEVLRLCSMLSDEAEGGWLLSEAQSNLLHLLQLGCCSPGGLRVKQAESLRKLLSEAVIATGQECDLQTQHLAAVGLGSVAEVSAFVHTRAPASGDASRVPVVDGLQLSRPQSLQSDAAASPVLRRIGGRPAAAQSAPRLQPLNELLLSKCTECNATGSAQGAGRVLQVEVPQGDVLSSQGAARMPGNQASTTQPACSQFAGELSPKAPQQPLVLHALSRGVLGWLKSRRGLARGSAAEGAGRIRMLPNLQASFPGHGDELERLVDGAVQELVSSRAGLKEAARALQASLQGAALVQSKGAVGDALLLRNVLATAACTLGHVRIAHALATVATSGFPGTEGSAERVERHLENVEEVCYFIRVRASRPFAELFVFSFCFQVLVQASSSYAILQ
jgi:hypothetical protein